jgi:hypothetical protein
MPLLGSAAMLLLFDVVPDAVAEHDDWHTHEHLPERLSIPGFLRGSRWVATRGPSRYLVLYEVAELATLTSAPYLERLNNPSAWTAKMMPHYRGMRRGLCTVDGSSGLGTGSLAYLVRFKPGAEAVESLSNWLLKMLAELPVRRGIGSAHLLHAAANAQMTNEQRIRGADAGVDSALLVMGYDADALSALARDVVGPGHFQRRGVIEAVDGEYRLDYMLTRVEVDTPEPRRR